MLQIPFPFDPERLPARHFDQVAAFIVLCIAFLTLIGRCLPRPLFVKCFKLLFPFMPDSIEQLEAKLKRRNDD